MLRETFNDDIFPIGYVLEIGRETFNDDIFSYRIGTGNVKRKM